MKKPRATDNQEAEIQRKQPQEQGLDAINIKVLSLYEEYLRLGLSNSEAAAVIATRLKEDDDTVREFLGLPDESLEVTLTSFKTGLAKLKQSSIQAGLKLTVPIGIPEEELNKAYLVSSRKSGMNP